jgi:hypothetical protein
MEVCGHVVEVEEGSTLYLHCCENLTSYNIISKLKGIGCKDLRLDSCDSGEVQQKAL